MCYPGISSDNVRGWFGADQQQNSHCYSLVQIPSFNSHCYQQPAQKQHVCVLCTHIKTFVSANCVRILFLLRFGLLTLTACDLTMTSNGST